MLENPWPGEGGSLAEFHRNESHAQDGQAGVEGPVARAGLVFLQLHVACCVIADLTAAPMTPDELREVFGGTRQTGAQEKELSFSARAYDRILKAAITLADLVGAESIRPADVSEAIQHQTLDRKLFL